jgi:hypothetical protein
MYTGQLLHHLTITLYIDTLPRPHTFCRYVSYCGHALRHLRNCTSDTVSTEMATNTAFMSFIGLSVDRLASFLFWHHGIRVTVSFTVNEQEFALQKFTCFSFHEFVSIDKQVKSLVSLQCYLLQLSLKEK